MSNKIDRLFDYIKIDIKTAQRLFSVYDVNIEIINIELITTGLSTTNYIVEDIKSKKKYLLKIYPENGGNSSLEVSSYKYASQYVNVPTIYLFDDSKQIYNKPYVIMDYINGITLKEYINNNKQSPKEIAYDIGSKLALLHNRKYNNMGLLDNNLDIKKNLLPVTKLHEHYLNGIAGKHISSNIRNELLEFLRENKDLVKKLDTNFVYSHGDFNTSNILIDNTDSSVWFIDFEYSLSAPIYLDIGKFFRDSAIFDIYRDKVIFDNFFNGYNNHAKFKLDNDWIKLAKLMDITSMLALLNKENPPRRWVEEIESEIVCSMRILKGEIGFKIKY